MRLLPRRALVALGTVVAALGATFAVAVPAAHATTSLWFSQSYSTNGLGTVTASVYTDASGNTYEDVRVVNSVHDGVHCVEGWVDFYLNAHRPANPFTACRNSSTGYYDSGQLPIHWPRSGSNAGAAVTTSKFTDHVNVKLALCDVETRFNQIDATWLERDNVACRQSGHEVGAIRDTSYSADSWKDMENIPYPCNANTWPSSCSVDMRPEYVSHGNIDLVFADETLNAGDAVVSFDAVHRAAMQSDGQFALYNDLSDSFVWGINGCLTAGRYLIPGDHMLLQSSDGNFVNWSGGWPVWASVNYNACSPTGSFGGAGQYLKMQNDGNFVEYYNGGVLWNTATMGR